MKKVILVVILLFTLIINAFSQQPVNKQDSTNLPVKDTIAYQIILYKNEYDYIINLLKTIDEKPSTIANIINFIVGRTSQLALKDSTKEQEQVQKPKKP